MNDDLVDLVNKSSKEKGIGNRLYGIKKINGIVHCKIVDSDYPVYWISLHELCSFHEKIIQGWINTGGEIDGEH